MMQKIKSINITLILLGIIILSSCQKQHRTVKKFNNWQQVSSWSFNGKMAINDSHNSGSGRINWQVTPMTTNAQFNAPLGQGNWSIFAKKNQARLTSSKNGDQFANNAETLIFNELGWHFPWDNLQYWLRGYKLNDNLTTHHNTPELLIDNGWEITYQKWMETPIGLLPKKIKATKDSYSVKLIIYAWEIK